MRYNKATIWALDDEQDVLDLYENQLGPNFKVETYTCPKKLLKNLKKKCPDLFILDYVLPEMSGVEVFKQIRERGICKPVIMLSGKMSYDTALELIQLGISDIIEKPFSEERLLFSTSRTVAAGMKTEARESLITAYSSLVSSMEGLINHYEFLLDGMRKAPDLSFKASEEVKKAKASVDFILRKRDMLEVMVGEYTED